MNFIECVLTKVTDVLLVLKRISIVKFTFEHLHKKSKNTTGVF